jgi:hypothetical protein
VRQLALARALHPLFRWIGSNGYGDASQIYQRRAGAEAVRRFVTFEFRRPCALTRRTAAATLLFAVPLLVVDCLSTSARAVLSVVSADNAAQHEQMYLTRQNRGRARRERRPGDVWFHRNNVGISFQCFGRSVRGPAASLLFLTTAPASAPSRVTSPSGVDNFFVQATHSAFELTAIVLSGGGPEARARAAAPGRRTRRQSLVHAAKECAPIVYGLADARRPRRSRRPGRRRGGCRTP